MIIRIDGQIVEALVGWSRKSNSATFLRVGLPPSAGELGLSMKVMPNTRNSKPVFTFPPPDTYAFPRLSKNKQVQRHE
jgi:hypothetical protein